MISQQSFISKDIQLQEIKSNNEGQSRKMTQTSFIKSMLRKTQNENNIEHSLNFDQDNNNSKLKCMRDMCDHKNGNIIKRAENTDNSCRIGIPGSQPTTFWANFHKVWFVKALYCNLRYAKCALIFVILCICFGVIVYISSNGVVIKKKILWIVNSLQPKKSFENSIDTKINVLDADIKHTVSMSSTTPLTSFDVEFLGQPDLIKEIYFDVNIESESADETVKKFNLDSFSKTMPPQKKEDESEVLSLLGFTSGHQNNFGVPIEEDERILKLLKKQDQETVSSTLINQTERSLIVSPTVPLLTHKFLESSTRSEAQEETPCQSTSFYMCRGVFQYDLTPASAKNLSFTPLEVSSFEDLISSNCSSRVAEFMCSILEPECRPFHTRLEPCRRFCKSVLETCSSLVITSDILTDIFDCDKYPDSTDRNVCEDPTRRGGCHQNEFQCHDLSCIPSKWLCDNIKDCEGGDDESNCLICDEYEFRCKSNEKCVDDRHRCDFKEDCSDGSDEWDCDSEFQNEHMLQFPKLISFINSLKTNTAGGNLFNSVFDDDRMPAGSEFNESVLATTIPTDVTTGILELSSSSEQTTSFKNSAPPELSRKETSHGKSKPNNETVSIPTPSSCNDEQLRCVSGKCITVNQLCDKVVDCPEGEDELMCVYEDAQPHS